MSELGQVLLASAGVIAALMVAVWLVSVLMSDASIVDIAWGAGFVVVAWAAFVVGDVDNTRAVLVPVLVSLWGLRLSGYLAWRNLGKGEDRRYQAMRRRWGPRFWWVSLVTVFLLQGALMWIVSLPVQSVQAVDGPSGFGALDGAGVAVFVTGLLFETVGDYQLARFKADPANEGEVMDSGLWRYTRHPNYFGDFCVWWGLGLIVLSEPGLWWMLAGPLVMSVLLLRVSGVTLLERSIVRRRPGYEEYRRRTSAFFPLPPKR